MFPIDDPSALPPNEFELPQIDATLFANSPADPPPTTLPPTTLPPPTGGH